MWAVYKKNLKHISILRWHMFCPEYCIGFRNILFNSDNVQSGTGYWPSLCLVDSFILQVFGLSC